MAVTAAVLYYCKRLLETLHSILTYWLEWNGTIGKTIAALHDEGRIIPPPRRRRPTAVSLLAGYIGAAGTDDWLTVKM